jgi:ferredoxin-NADP reductase
MSDANMPTAPVASARQRPALRARVERIYDHCADTRSLFLRMTVGTLPRFLPGMFISVAIPLLGDARVRPYTIASSPEDGEPFEICFNRLPGGLGAAWLFDRVNGDELSFTGPFGAFTLERPPAAETILIAEGTAIAPIRPMLRRAIAGAPADPQTISGLQTPQQTSSAGPETTQQARSEQPTPTPVLHPRYPIKLCYLADRSEHLLYASEFERLAAAHNNFDYEPIIVGGHDSIALDAPVLDDGSRAALDPRPLDEPKRAALYARLLDEVHRRWVAADSDRSRHFYICGVGKGVLAMRDLLRAAGYERRAVRYEQW